MTLKSTRPGPSVMKMENQLRQIALSYPEVTEESPWGHRAFKVKGKTFLFLSADAAGLGLSTKLPKSGPAALKLAFTEPTHYGLGKSGWVSAQLAAENELPLALLRGWIDESYRAIAPKRVLMQLDAPSAIGTQGPAKKKTGPTRKETSPTRKQTSAAPRKRG